MKKPSKPYRPFHPPEWNDQIALAIQAVAAGIASEAQQQNAMKWIINDLCGTYDLNYFPDSDRDTVFASAKRFIGLQLVKLIKIKVGKMNPDKS